MRLFCLYISPKGIVITSNNDSPEIISVTNDGPINEGGRAIITVLASDVDDSDSALRYHSTATTLAASKSDPK